MNLLIKLESLKETQWHNGVGEGDISFYYLKTLIVTFYSIFVCFFVTYFYAKTQRYSILRSSEYVKPLMICMACTLFY